MQLILNSVGMALRVKDGLFQISLETRKLEIAPKKVNSIIITTGVFLTTDAIKLAIENTIDIVLLDSHGNPYGRVWSDRPGSITTIRRKQLALMEAEEGLGFVKEWISRKITNQIVLLERFRKTRSKHSAEITKTLGELGEFLNKLGVLEGKIDEVREKVLSLEALAARSYFSLLSGLLPERFQFEGRSRNPAKDFFNCLLNYSYGVLYGKVERACVLAGLDPYIGILHTDNYNKKSLVFDLIENFRAWADETVMDLFAAREVKESMFDKLQNGFTLNKQGKEVLLKRLCDFLDKPVRYRNRNIKRLDIVQLECHRVANRLIGKSSESDLPEIVEAGEAMNELK